MIQKFNHVLFTFYEGCLCRRRNSIKNQVKRVVSRPNTEEEAVRADISKLPTNPYNLVATNIHSVYGGLGNRETWKNSSARVLRHPSIKKKESNVMHTSCDENTMPDQLVQRYDDDKLELMCY